MATARRISFILGLSAAFHSATFSTESPHTCRSRYPPASAQLVDYRPFANHVAND